MKNQLLEDFGDSASQPVPAGRSTPPPLPAPAPAAVQHPPKVWRERAVPAQPPRPVWRARDAAAPPEPPSAPVPPPPPPPRQPLSEPLPPMFADDRFSISSQQPDLAIQFPKSAPTWTERWGRKLLGWGAGLAVVAAAAGAGLWMVQDTQVVSTLALVADEAPPAAVRWSEPERDVGAPPPLVMLPPEASAPVVAAPATDIPAPAATVDAVDAPETPALDDNGEAAARAAAEAVRRAEARRIAARKEAARKEAIKKETVRKEAAREVARKEAVRKEAARLAAAKAAEPEAQRAETLRQCRAAGYHASQCLQRGCVATKFGLACRG